MAPTGSFAYATPRSAALYLIPIQFGFCAANRSDATEHEDDDVAFSPWLLFEFDDDRRLNDLSIWMDCRMKVGFFNLVTNTTSSTAATRTKKITESRR
jgi:hypothetical protein